MSPMIIIKVPFCNTTVKQQNLNFIIYTWVYSYSMPIWLPWKRSTCVPHCVSLKDVTFDLAVVSACLHDVAWVTVTLVWAWTVDAQLTAHNWALALINIGTGQPVLHEPEPCCTATTLHRKNHILRGSATVKLRTSTWSTNCLFIQNGLSVTHF